jgi:hypothetical protein
MSDATAPVTAHRFTPAPATSHGEQDASRWDESKWYTIAQTAELCHRHPRTILNWLSAYQIHRRSGWVTRHRRRRKVIFLRSSTVAWLVEVIVFGNQRARLDPPR